ncbi:MAG TPA: dTMP kinase [Chthoniobacterales bacterium]|nr:dTMP kinase [Chthoniobacterales bacterium]
MPGFLITFEGGEASGKSTQVARLTRRLEATGQPVTVVHDPGTTDVGRAIRQLLLHARESNSLNDKTELLLFAASRSQLIEEIIRPALNEGRVVVSDRFADSTAVYQGYARGIDQQLIGALEKFLLGEIRPKLTFVLDLDLPTMRKRQLRRVRPVNQVDRLEQLPDAFHERVRQGYLELARREPGRIRVIDASLPESEIAEIIWKEWNALSSRRSS